MRRAREGAGTGLAVALSLALGAAPVCAADLSQATRDMLRELGIDGKILAGSETEHDVPAEWRAQARKEGALRIIGTWDSDQHRRFVAPFHARYPEIRVDYVRAGRNDRAVKPLVAFKEGRFLADVISGLGNAHFAFRDAGALEKIDDLPNVRLLDRGLVDPDGLWVGHQASYWCVSYNTRLVKKDDLPRTWDGFLDASKWGQGRIGMGNRANLWFLQLWKEYGADWGRNYMDKLFGEVKPQQRKEGMNALVALNIAGEIAVTIPSAMYRVKQMAEKGAPVGYHCPEPVPATVQSIVALKGNPHPNAARLYINWLLSKEGQIAQFHAMTANSVRDELQIPELTGFPEQIKGKRKAFRDERLLYEEWPRVLEVWSAAWNKAAGAGGGRRAR
ncbi:MAG: hypothetical protein RL477_1868 [Pseudomonadota bacterium]|jgi:ABC-type Fe3+ transport system substrate-binding protein